MVSPRVRNELPLILASLFIAAVLWLIAKQADYEPDRLQAAIKLESVPGNLVVEAPPKVNIVVQYPKRISSLIVERNFSIPVNVEKIFGAKPEETWDPRQPEKTQSYPLRPSSVKSDLAPAVQVVSVDPPEIQLKARLRTATAEVSVQTSGKLEENLILAGIKPDPAQVTFAGSIEAIKKVTDAGMVKTEPIDLSVLRAPGRQFTSHVIMPDPTLFLLGQRTITINVAVVEKPKRKTIPGVPITLVTFGQNLRPVVEPATASVVLEGPASALEMVGPGDIEFSTIRPLEERPGRVNDVGLEARLKATLPADVAKSIKIVETKPTRVSVEFVADK